MSLSLKNVNKTRDKEACCDSALERVPLPSSRQLLILRCRHREEFALSIVSITLGLEGVSRAGLARVLNSVPAPGRGAISGPRTWTSPVRPGPSTSASAARSTDAKRIFLSLGSAFTPID